MGQQYNFTLIFMWLCCIIFLGFLWYNAYIKKEYEYAENYTNKTSEEAKQYLSNSLNRLMDDALKNELPTTVKGIAFIIHSDNYEEAEWELDILGTYNKKYSPQDEDWASDDFMPLQKTYKWKQRIGRDQLFLDIKQIIEEYLINGEYSAELKSLEAVGLSFDDGKVDLLYLNN